MQDYAIETRYIFTTSLHRNTTAYPKTSEFRLDLPDDFNNVSSLELVAGTVPNLDNVNLDPYLLLSIDGLNHIRASNGVEYFSVLALHKGHSDSFFNMDRSSSAMMPNSFYSPKQRISSLILKLLHPDGTSLAFGTAGNLLQINQTSFMFAIKTLSNKRPADFDKDFRKLF
jgi:hypothetical protein